MAEFRTYLSGRLPQFLFLVLAASALFSTVTYGFHIEDSLRQNLVLVVAWSALLMSGLTLISYSPRMIAIGGAAFVIVSGIIVSVAAITSGSSPFDDKYGNLGFMLLIGFIVCVLVYLLTRRKGLALANLVLGVLTCAFVQFLYLNNLLLQLIVFFVAAAALYVLKAQSNDISSSSRSSFHFSPLLIGAGLCAISVGIAAAVFFLVIAPLNPPTQQVKIFTKYYALEEVHVSGTEKLEHQTSEYLKSNKAESGDNKTKKTNDETKDVKTDNSTNAETGNQGNVSTGSQGSSITGFGAAAGAVRYFFDYPIWLLSIAAVVLLVALSIIVKKFLRARHFKAMRSRDPYNQLVAFYFFFQRRLARFGIRKPRMLSPLEYAMQYAEQHAPFEQGADGATYIQLAKAYCDCIYGNRVPTEGELDICVRLYRAFYPAACKIVSKPNYCLKKFFFI